VTAAAPLAQDAVTAATAETADRAGRLVAVEGIDASGKTSLAELVVAALVGRGERALLVNRATAPDLATGYPGDHLRALRRLIWEYDADARTSVLGFEHWAHLIAAWFTALDRVVVRPALDTGHVVVADSWYHKFAARFAVQVGLGRATAIFRDVTEPDDVLLLDVPPEVCAARRAVVRTTEAGEWQGLSAEAGGFVAYQSRVREGYLAMAAESGWTTLPAAEPDELLRLVDAFLSAERTDGSCAQR